MKLFSLRHHQRYSPLRTTTRTVGRLILLTVMLSLFLTGCTSIAVWLGWKVPLERISITSISAMLPKGSGIVPGQTVQLVVSVTEPNGEVLQAAGFGDGKVIWSDLAITSSVVTVDAHGKVSLADDPRISDGRIAHVTVTVPSHPDLRADLDIPIRYHTKFNMDFSGNNGMDGMNGTDGMDGFMGSSGSIDPNNPSAGGDGGNGTDGSDGQDGGNGSNAPPVEVKVTFRGGITPLLQIEVTANKQQKFFLLDPEGGSLTVKADGGQGGSGGHGGHGGRGGMGGNGSPSGMNGNDGFDGRNGFDGVSGRGGLITVTYDPAAKPYLNAIHLSSRNGPKPVFVETHVEPLW